MNHIAFTLAQAQFFEDDAKHDPPESGEEHGEKSFGSLSKSVSFSKLFNEEPDALDDGESRPKLGSVSSPTSTSSITSPENKTETHSSHDDVHVVRSFFDLAPSDEILHAHSCALIRSVLFPGKLYITKKHICFASNLHRKGSLIEGYMTKARKLYSTRLWVVLNIDGLSYYKDSQSTYTPLRRIAIHDIVGVEKGEKNKIVIFNARRKPLTLTADSAQQQVEWFETFEFSLYSFKRGHKYEKLKIPLDITVSIEPNLVFAFPNAVTISTFDTQYFFALFDNMKEVMSSFHSVWSIDRPREPILSDEEESGGEDDPESRRNSLSSPLSSPPLSPSIALSPTPAGTKDDESLLLHIPPDNFSSSSSPPTSPPLSVSSPIVSVAPKHTPTSSPVVSSSKIYAHEILPENLPENSSRTNSTKNSNNNNISTNIINNENNITTTMYVAPMISSPTLSSSSAPSSSPVNLPPSSPSIIPPPRSTTPPASAPLSSSSTITPSSTTPPSSSSTPLSPPPSSSSSSSSSSPSSTHVSSSSTHVPSIVHSFGRTLTRTLHRARGHSSPASPPLSSSPPSSSPAIIPASSTNTIASPPSSSTTSSSTFSPPTSPPASRRESTKNEEFRKLFHITDDDVIVREYQCGYQGLGGFRGKLYLSRKRVSYYHRVPLGSKSTKMSVLFTDIVSIWEGTTSSYVPHAITISTKDGAEYCFHSFISRARVFHRLHRMWDEAHEAAGPGIDSLLRHFNLPPEETLVSSVACSLNKTYFVKGRLYITSNYVCFKSSPYTLGRKVVIPFSCLDHIETERYGFLFSAVRVTTNDQQSFVFSFVDKPESLHDMLQSQWDIARENNYGGHTATSPKTYYDEGDGDEKDESAGPSTNETPIAAPDMFKDVKLALTSFGNGLNVKPMKITILTIGSRGDVQPFVALGKGLQAAGHSVVLATHEEFREFVTEHGLEFKVLGGNPRELMQLVVNNGIFTVKFMKTALQSFRGFVEQLLANSWEVCQGTDAIIEAPSAMAGIHVAEALGVPYFNAFTMPWTRTYSFPNPFAVPERPLGRGYNYFSYYMVEQMFWQPIRDMVNHFRVKIGLETIAVGSGGHALHTDVPYLYCFSKFLVPKPPDWADWITLCGFWFLDSPSTYVPPKDLLDFIEAGPPPIYIGFGSIVVNDPDALTKIILEAIALTGQRTILAKGWADMGLNEVPPTVFQIAQAPHDWLFPRMSLVCHHGGAGTTAAGLRYGKPTVIVPFFGDQFFWGQRVREMGVGDSVPHKSLTSLKLAKAILQCLNEPQVLKKAKLLGEHIRSEDGVWTAVNSFHKYLDKARLTQRLAKDAQRAAQEEKRSSQEEKMTAVASPKGL